MVKIIFKEAKVTFASKADNYSDLKDEISEKFVSFLFRFKILVLSLWLINISNSFYIYSQNLHQSLFYLTSTNGKIVSKENFTNCHQIQLSLRTLGGNNDNLVFQNISLVKFNMF